MTNERTETHACDSISRRAAIAAFSNNGSFFVYGADVCKAIVSRIKQLPAVEPERKAGRWIKEHIDITDKEHPKSFRFHRCSACGHVAAPALFVGEKWLSYCPHCGAYMGGDEE